MKLLFIIKALHNMAGGAERVMADVTDALTRRGHDITVLCFDEQDKPPFYSFNERINMVRLGIGDTTHKTTPCEITHRIAAIRKYVAKKDYDVAVPFMHSSFVPAALALAGTGIPVIASEHIVPEHYKSRPLEYLSLLISIPFLNHITVLSSAVKCSYPALIRRKMQVVHNPVKLERRAANDHKKKKIILNVGRLDPQKDQKTLISAFARLSDDYPEWTLRIIGDGALENELRDQIASLGLEGRVQIPGRTKEINTEYDQASFFVMSSLYESFGLATAEAMARGVPAIGFSDCMGTNEIISDNVNGLLIDLDHTNNNCRITALEQAMRRMIDDNDLRNVLGQNAPDTLKNIEIDAVTDRWEELLTNVTMRRAG